ncbi:hypothetical protein ACJRO7_013340 [Eucalyptus globulus]|uniref:Xyloglucan endotransglucosylase/hydrolase n=1 Tax=Eucalyptus globulus TaxID=34317 RepID=A0ABD3L2U1_EUCGL
MGSPSSEAKGLVLCVLSMVAWSGLSLVARASDFNKDFDINWGDGRAKILDSGDVLTLSLDKDSGSGFQSKNQYLFGKINMQIKLVPGNSAGTVTSYYLKSEGTSWDEIDFEFLGNLSGDPYVIHTNVYTQGKGDREQQCYLWFDPTADFHTYSILWNPQTIIFSVDNTPIREFRNLGSNGVAFPKSQPMRLHSTLWNADDWATRGGLVKTDWRQAPFTASYRSFSAEACVWVSGSSSCGPMDQPGWFTAKMDADGQAKMKSVQREYMIYNYCTDTKRFPSGFAPECAIM